MWPPPAPAAFKQVSNTEHSAKLSAYPNPIPYCLLNTGRSGCCARMETTCCMPDIDLQVDLH